MSTSDEVSAVSLSIRTEDPATEIFLLDDQFVVKAQGVGRLETQQEPGIYKIKLRAGYDNLEEVVFLQGPSFEKTYPPVTISSPIPLDHTRNLIKSHAEAADQQSRKVHVPHGKGSWIFLFARDYPSSYGSDGPDLIAQNPAEGLGLMDTTCKMFVDFGAQSEKHQGENPWAACSVEVNPGLYCLCLKTPRGEIMEQTVYAAKNCQTQIFVTQTVYEHKHGSEHHEGAAEPKKIPDLIGAAMLISPERLFRSDNRYARVAELARLGLSNRRKVLSDELRDMLRYKFEEPILGIYGAHLLLLEATPDLDLFNEVINNLRKLLGNEHPDVEALSLAMGFDATSYVFRAPPMLRRSWPLVLRATVKRPGLVPIGSLASQVADCFLGVGPWLTWIPPAPRREEQLSAPAPEEEEKQTDLEAALESLMLPYHSAKLSLPALIENVSFKDNTVFTNLLSTVQSAFASLMGTISKDYEASLEHTAKFRTSEVHVGEEEIKKLVESLGIPRANVEELLCKSAKKLRKKLETRQNP